MHPTGETQHTLFPLDFNRSIVVQDRPKRLTADAGVLALRQIDHRLGLTDWRAAQLTDPRNPDLVTHPPVELLRTRLYLIAQGHRDADDADRLGLDPAFRLAVSQRRGTASWGHEYDPLGNRGTFVEDPTTPAATTTYYTNELNQYHRSRRFVSAQQPIVAQGFRHDDDGNLAETFISGDMNCDGQVNFGDVNAFTLAVSNPAGYHQQYPNCNILNGDINGDGFTNIGDVNALVALLGHTAGGVGLRSEYLWDAENRLIEVRPTDGTQAYGDKKVKFWYDYLGRCVQKEVRT